MSNEPTVSGKRLIKLLSRKGFEVIRTKGSHHFLRHLDGRSTVVPVHGNEDIGKGILRKILKDCDLNVADILNSSN